MKKIHPGKFRVKENKKVGLKDYPTHLKPFYKSKSDYHKQLASQVAELSALQGALYAQDQYALLLILQGMDASGKDSAIKHVMSGVNPQGCEVFSFKQPSAEELDHDFLWRAARRLPERGRIGIFNRSYYEEVLVVRVHPELLKAERIPGLPAKQEKVWEDRYRSIQNFEHHLHKNGTRILKFYLHLSSEEQRRRFLKRIDEPDKNWKFSTADLKERKHWHKYRQAFEACLSATSTDFAPWFIVPADDKKNSRLIISQIILDTMKQMKIAYPVVSRKHRQELKSMKKSLGKE